METVPELQSVLGEDKVHDLIELGKNRVNGDEAKPVLKAAFTTLMTLPKDVVTDSVSALVSRLAQEKEVIFHIHISLLMISSSELVSVGHFILTGIKAQWTHTCNVDTRCGN